MKRETNKQKEEEEISSSLVQPVVAPLIPAIKRDSNE